MREREPAGGHGAGGPAGSSAAARRGSCPAKGAVLPRPRITGRSGAAATALCSAVEKPQCELLSGGVETDTGGVRA